MSIDAGLYRLQSWLSPSYPVGAYTFSHGIETAVEQGAIRGAADAEDWLRDIVSYGNGRADLAFLAAGWAAHDDEAALTAILDYAHAFQATRELRLESVAQGEAFLRVSQAAWRSAAGDRLERLGRRPLAYPVVVGAIAAAHGIERRATLLAFGHAFVANLVSAAVRLVPLGQTDGQKIISALEAIVVAAVERALETPVERIATSAVRVDITSMNHEVQYTRLFRS